ncbi:MAG: histidine phosphatase family protein [Bryobacterales bacterium]|jgi:phosphohistidine phosphatase|nr:histidine phosphatase family protein [Bryobacterales bacterium]
MTLFLLRHAIAEDRSSTGLDRDRALTPEGIERLTHVLRIAASAGVRPAVILSSPYLRANQTAQHAHKLLKCKQPIVLTDALTPNASPLSAWDEIRLHEQAQSVLAVSHDPLISSLFSYLLGVSQYVHSFKKAGLAKFEFIRTGARPSCEVQWILTPALANASASIRD